MKHVLTIILLFCSLTISAQSKIITGPKSKQPAKTVAQPKQQTASKQGAAQSQKQVAKPKKSTTAAMPKQQTVATKPKSKVVETTPKLSKPSRYPQELSTETITVDGVSFNMCYVKGGSFLMGATPEQEWVGYDATVHKVTLSDYYIGQTEVTQALWKAVMGYNPSYRKGDDRPVESVSWDDCNKFIEKLNSKTGLKFRMPTEAEWEFAARGGNNSGDFKYSGGNVLGSVAWSIHNCGPERLHPVATKQANELGIFDMSGNVQEYCSDRYGEDYYKNGSSENPTGPATGDYRVVRGGHWYSNEYRHKNAHRDFVYRTSDKNDWTGLRIVLEK